MKLSISVTVIMFMLLIPFAYGFSVDTGTTFVTADASITVNLGTSTSDWTTISWDSNSFTYDGTDMQFSANTGTNPTVVIRQINTNQKVKFDITANNGALTTSIVNSVARRPDSVAYTTGVTQSSIGAAEFYTVQADFNAAAVNAVLWIESTRVVSVKNLHTAQATTIEIIIPAVSLPGGGQPGGQAQSGGDTVVTKGDDSGDFQRVDFEIVDKIVYVYLIPHTERTKIEPNEYRVDLMVNSKVYQSKTVSWSQEELKARLTKSVLFVGVDLSSAPIIDTIVKRQTKQQGVFPVTHVMPKDSGITLNPSQQILASISGALSSQEGRVEIVSRMFIVIVAASLVSMIIKKRGNSPAIPKPGKRFIKTMEGNIDEARERFKKLIKRRDW